MAGRYSIDDLLKLRASPLISKPSNILAIVDILTPSESAKKLATRGKLDDSSTQPDGFPKRPLLDNQQRKSTSGINNVLPREPALIKFTDPDRIVLGPPRRSFASSTARALGNPSQDSPAETSLPQKANAAEKYRNGDASDAKSFERRTNQTNGRYSRNEHDSTDEKARNPMESEDETKLRKDLERKTKWGSVEDEQPRNKFEQPWFRRDRGRDTAEDTKPDGGRQPAWRQERTRDRPWERNAPAEEEPEWMDEPAEEEANPVRTQEDFQRWKERMKAGKTGGISTEEVQTPSSPEPTNTKSQNPTKAFVDVEADDSMDKFFARFNEAKVTNTPVVATKSHTKTRFASLFSPPVEQPFQPPQSIESPIPATDMFLQEKPSQTPVEIPSADADQAGFARILEMLQGRNQHAASAKAQETKFRAREGQSNPDEKITAPSLLDLLPQARQADTRPTQAQQHAPESASSNEHAHNRQQSNKDELLLNLLRQANQAPKPTPVSSPLDHYAARGMFNNEEEANWAAVDRNRMIAPHSVSRPESGRPHENLRQQPMRYPDELNPHEHLRRRPTGEFPGQSEYDMHLLNSLRGQGRGEQKPGTNIPQSQPPPGLGRPPGFDQLPRAPPWQSQQPQPPRQNLPPGMPNIPRNLPAQFGGPNVPPQLEIRPPPQFNIRPPQAPPPPHRKYTGEAGLPGFPPMGPPPGFVNNGPPPGFPGATQGYGRFQGPPEPPQGLGRAFMDMYGDAGRGGLRGGAGTGMPGYR